MIFQDQGCNSDACHGSARSGGLDLRPDAAYASLLSVGSTSSDLPRIQPGRDAVRRLLGYQSSFDQLERFR